MGSTDKVVILDRDGTIIVDKHYLSDPAGVELLPGAAEGLRKLIALGFRLVVITNQSGVGRGKFSLKRMSEVNTRFLDVLRAEDVQIESVFYCPHAPDANCECRKPKIGLATQAASELGFTLGAAIVIGDKDSDVEFGHRAGAMTVLIAGEASPEWCDASSDLHATDLLDAARQIKERLCL